MTWSLAWSLLWSVLRPAAPWIAGVLALYGAYWYVGSLRAEITQQRAAIQAAQGERDDAIQAAKAAQANIRARIRAAAENEANEREVLKLLRQGRAGVPAVADRLRDYRTVPAGADPAGRQPDAAGSREPAGCAADAARAAEIDRACAQVSAERSAFAAELLRLDRALREGAAGR